MRRIRRRWARGLKKSAKPPALRNRCSHGRDHSVPGSGCRPAGAGDVVIIYAAGLGAVNPPVEPEVPGGASPLRPTVEPARVTVDGAEMPLFYSPG